MDEQIQDQGGTHRGSGGHPGGLHHVHIDRGAVSFQVPIHLEANEYDDTEMVRAARSALHRTFVELAAQSQDWKLSAKDLRQLSGMSLRPR